jgi:hypothetical protein
MATNIEIPTQSGAPFTERITLQDVVYTLDFHWNTVAKVWNLDFYDDTGQTPILRGVALVTGCDLLEQFAYLPLGARLILTTMTIGPGISPDTVPGFYNLGTDGRLYATMPSTV